MSHDCRCCRCCSCSSGCTSSEHPLLHDSTNPCPDFVIDAVLLCRRLLYLCLFSLNWRIMDLAMEILHRTFSSLTFIFDMNILYCFKTYAELLHFCWWQWSLFDLLHSNNIYAMMNCI